MNRLAAIAGLLVAAAPRTLAAQGTCRDFDPARRAQYDSAGLVLAAASTPSYYPEPVYPSSAAHRRVGHVVLEFIIDTTGLADPRTVSVQGSSGVDFTVAACQALLGARFAVTLRTDGRKARVLARHAFVIRPPSRARSH
jgi:hypothetical protein